MRCWCLLWNRNTSTTVLVTTSILFHKWKQIKLFAQSCMICQRGKERTKQNLVIWWKSTQHGQSNLYLMRYIISYHYFSYFWCIFGYRLVNSIQKWQLWSTLVIACWKMGQRGLGWQPQWGRTYSSKILKEWLDVLIYFYIFHQNN